MQPTLNMATAGVGAIGAGGQNYLQTTRDVFKYLVIRTYIASLIFAIPVGLIGDYNGWRHLGYVPGIIGLILVHFYYWVFEARLLGADASLQIVPDWLQKRILEWSTKPGHVYNVFRGTSEVGLWLPCLLWVPAEFAVWRHPIHFLSALAVTMAITQFVATMEAGNKFWRYLYGTFVTLFAVRHGLGLMGHEVELEELWADRMALLASLRDLINPTTIIAVGIGVVLYGMFRKK